ncbi:MAG: SH3 domain-containing protein [Chloroflexi bacterium]|nr:SH3 domain-containing protein [Chloroflexota bacterium]
MRKLPGVLIVLLLVAVALAVVPPEPTQADTTRQVTYCADFDGSTNDIVRAEIPAETIERGDVYCRVIAIDGEFVRNAAEIGDPAVLDQGVIQAVDVYGMSHGGQIQNVFNERVKVCLLGRGTLWYLDATVSPRYLQRLAITREGSYTCGRISGPGTVVLTERDGDGSAPFATGAPARSSSDNDDADGDGIPPVDVVSPASAVPLEDCYVVTRAILNLRAGPGLNYEVLRFVQYDVRLQADARQGNWFHVGYQGTPGWLSGTYLNISRTCGD